MNVRYLTVALLTALTLGAGCVRHAITQDFGLSGIASPRAKRPAAQAIDTPLRAVFKRQIQGAFNPLSDDARVQALETRLKSNPQDAAARLELGGVYEIYKLYDNAFEQYRQALQLSLSDGAAAEQAIAGLSRSARASRRAQEAIGPVETLLQQRPSAASWIELGLLYQAVSDLGKAEIAFAQAVTLDPESDRAYNNLGYNLLLENKIEAAEAELRRTLELNPSSTTARNNLGTVLARRGDFEGALQEFQLAADVATAHNNLAVVLLEMGQYERSREELVKALAIRRYFAPALANFKLVQERIRERTELQKVGRLPLSAVRVPSAIVAEAGPTAADPPSADQREISTQKDSEDKP